jgi:hypothetical protein
MFGWMVLVMSLASFSAAGTGGAHAPVALGRGVTVTPAPGWVSAHDVWNVGPGAVSLQHAGVLAVFAADSYDGTARQLLDEQLASLKAQFGSLRLLPPAPVALAGGIPALKVLFSGTADSADLEGELVAGTSGGTGAVMLAVALTGQVARVQSDLDAMLDSLAVAR